MQDDTKRSTIGMVAHIQNIKDSTMINTIAIPVGLTFSQVNKWLTVKGFINEYWFLNGIYEYK